MQILEEYQSRLRKAENIEDLARLGQVPRPSFLTRLFYPKKAEFLKNLAEEFLEEVANVIKDAVFGITISYSTEGVGFSVEMTREGKRLIVADVGWDEFSYLHVSYDRRGFIIRENRIKFEETRKRVAQILTKVGLSEFIAASM